MPVSDKVELALNRLKSCLITFNCRENNIYVAHSGGKDSVVVHHLARQVFGDAVKVIHTPKISGFNRVHPDTVAFLYEVAANYGMYMVPSGTMKEFLLSSDLFVQVDGTRRDEAERTDRSSNVIIDGEDISRTHMTWFTENSLFGQQCVFPIYDWSDEDVWKYIEDFSIPYSKEYNSSPAR